MTRLIDADALKEALEVIPYNDIDDLARTERLIDNAPTVFDEKAYSDGYAQGTCDCKHDHERPKGEWIKNILSFECPVCGEKFFSDDEDENLQDYDPVTDLRWNFCPNCGADMREADNEQ